MLGLLIVIVLNILHVENKPMTHQTPPPLDVSEAITDLAEQKTTVIPEYTTFEDDIEENSFELDSIREKIMKPCAVVVLSNIQDSNVQSLVRKYRYDSNGVLIPSSVKYFVKLPSGAHSSPILVPLHDKAFSPTGGFVRYYKEIPPIPQIF